MRRVILIGATDGIGLALARVYLSRLWWVALLGRDPARLAGVADTLRAEHPEATLSTHLCDVTDHDAVRPAFDAALVSLGHADLVIYCAGVLHAGDGATCDPDADVATLDANLLGAARALDLAANYFREIGRGHLVGIGSIAGERGRKGNPAYCASKAGLHAYLEGLRNRLHPYGVTVSTVKPGFVRTKMLEGRERVPGAIDAAAAAHIIARALDRGRESFFVPWWWRWVGVAVKACPRFLFKRIGPP